MESKRILRTKRKKEKTMLPFLSTGSTLLDLACSGNVAGGFLPGKYYFMVGDSSSGKTFISLTCFAEASINPAFSDYRLIYDNSEDGALMDFQRYFGQKMAGRIEPPETDKTGVVFSSTIEDFYFHVDDAIQDGRPFIYVLDSMDSLTSSDETAKFDEHKEASRKGKTAPGSYGDGKAKKNSSNLRRLLSALKRSGSILIIINQTRDNLTGMGYEKKTRSGGHALKFYATLEIWLSVKEKIRKTINGKPRQLGIISQVKIKKNRITGKDLTVEVPIYHSHGIDDVGGCIRYLIDEGRWKKTSGRIQASEFDFSGREEELIQKIESDGLEKDLKDLVAEVWTEIDEKTKVRRKSRYE